MYILTIHIHIHIGIILNCYVATRRYCYFPAGLKTHITRKARRIHCNGQNAWILLGTVV